MIIYYTFGECGDGHISEINYPICILSPLIHISEINYPICVLSPLLMSPSCRRLIYSGDGA